MGFLSEHRLTASAVCWKATVSDIAGPIWVRHPTVTKGPRSRAYVLVECCEFSRQISLMLVPKLDAKTIMKAFEALWSKRGRPEVVRTDLMGGFTAAARLADEDWPLESTRAGQREADNTREVSALSNQEFSVLRQQMRSRNCTIQQKVSHAAFSVGGAERGVQMFKRNFKKSVGNYFSDQFQ